MSELDHKLVCWGDYAIPVPIDDNWLVFDADGESFTSEHMPTPYKPFKSWETKRSVMNIMSIDCKLVPPEPGPWQYQLYWIGD